MCDDRDTTEAIAVRLAWCLVPERFVAGDAGLVESLQCRVAHQRLSLSIAEEESNLVGCFLSLGKLGAIIRRTPCRVIHASKLAKVFP